MATVFLLLIYLAFISLGLPDSLLGAAWPVMHIDLGLPLDAAGMLSIIITAGTIVSSLLSEKLTSRFGTGRVTAVSVLATAVALVVASFSTNVWWMVAIAVPLGLGAGAVDAALNNYVALHYQPRHMSWLHSFWGVGAFIGPVIMGGFLAQDGNWQGGYRTVGIIQLVVCALLFISLPMWKKREGLPKGQLPNKAEGQKAAPAPMNGSAIRIPGVVPALLTFTLYCSAEMGVGLWGASYLTSQRGFTEAGAASAVSLFFAGITAGRILSGFLTMQLKGSVLIRLGILIVGVGGVLLALPLPGWVAPVALGLIGFGCAPIYPSMIHETPGRFGAQHSAKIIGWQMASAYTGSTLAPPILGFVAARAGMWVFPVFILLCAAGMLLLSERINSAVKKKAA